MKPFCSWRELILIQPIKVSNNKSFLQRQICAEVWGSAAGLVELRFLKSVGAGRDFPLGAPSLVGLGRMATAGSVHKVETQPGTTQKERESKPAHF